MVLYFCIWHPTPASDTRRKSGGKFKGTPVIAGYPPTANHGCSNGGLVTDSSSEGCMDTGLA